MAIGISPRLAVPAFGDVVVASLSVRVVSATEAWVRDQYHSKQYPTPPAAEFSGPRGRG